MTTDTAGNQTEFAAFMGVSKFRVTEWKRASRLVFDADGKVDFLASRDKIEETSGAPERLGIFSEGRASAREEKDHLEILRMRLDLDERAGSLIETARVAEAAAAAGAVLRSRIENMPYVLTPQLAASSGVDEERCRAVLIAWCEEYLTECSAAMLGLATTARAKKA